MLDNITFVDLVSLTRITPDSTVERFGGLINSSFFDASNILGTLKQKGLVDFITSFPSQSAISVTEQGKQLIAEVQQKSTTPFDTLDMAILVQLSNGKRSLQDLTGGVNVTSKDLATHLYKLSIQQFLSYELRNGNMNITLTEKGFLRVKEGIPRDAQGAMQPPGVAQQPVTNSSGMGMQPSMDQSGMPDMSATQSQDPAAGAPKTEMELKALEIKIMHSKRVRAMLVFVIVVIIVIAVFYLYLTHGLSI